jgi:hypothetical protein
LENILGLPKNIYELLKKKSWLGSIIYCNNNKYWSSEPLYEFWGIFYVLRDAFRIPPDPWSGAGITQKEKLVWFPLFIVDAINIEHQNYFMSFCGIFIVCPGIFIDYS